MKNKDVDEEKLQNGEYCQKGSPGCFCKVGWPYERMCPDCRDGRAPGDNRSYCVCSPKESSSQFLTKQEE